MSTVRRRPYSQRWRGGGGTYSQRGRGDGGTKAAAATVLAARATAMARGKPAVCSCRRAANLRSRGRGQHVVGRRERRRGRRRAGWRQRLMRCVAPRSAADAPQISAQRRAPPIAKEARRLHVLQRCRDGATVDHALHRNVVCGDEEPEPSCAKKRRGSGVRSCSSRMRCLCFLSTSTVVA